MTLLKNIAAEPGREVNIPPPEEVPTIEVPGVNLNTDIDNALLRVMRGEDVTTQETNAAIQNLLGSLGGGREDRLTKRQLGAAERFGVGQRNAEEQLRSQLANQGLVGVPGAPQGAETAGMRRSLERLSVPFAQELRETEIRESELADAREINALQLATGWSQGQAQRVLQAAAAGTDRQRIMSDIALGTLDRNIAWNQFLFDAGLRREQVANDIRTGRIDRIGAILAEFAVFLQQMRGGFLGND